MTPEEKKAKQAIIETFINQISEHFETIQVFVSFHSEAGDTLGMTRHRGNYYARYGQITEWLDVQKGMHAADGHDEHEDRKEDQD